MRPLHLVIFLVTASYVVCFQLAPRSLSSLAPYQRVQQISNPRRIRHTRSQATSSTPALSEPRLVFNGWARPNLRPFAISIAVAAFAACLLRWFQMAFIQSGASLRIQANPRFFLTIPILAGVCNAITNKLAVWMMFYPLHFRGFFQKLGWQGIVPRQVRRMGADISDMLLGELLDVEEVLKQIDPIAFAEILVDEKLLAMCQSVVVDYITEDSKSLDFLPRETKQKGVKTLLTKDRLSHIVARVVRAVQEDVDTCIDVKHQVVEAMAADPSLIVDLFQTCGKNELKFMVVSGGYGGALLGLGQMVSYAMFPQAWTLVAGGALVGWATDTLALKIMFEPVEPIRIFGRKLQGLFLQRQAEVSEDFAEFTAEQILPPVSLWKALLTGPQRNAFQQKVQRAIAAEVPLLDDKLEGELAKVTQNVMKRFTDDYSIYTEATYEYMSERLSLKERIRLAMVSLPSARFERVLHPVFEQDEAALIAVGSILGGLVGFAQAVGGC